MTQRSRPQADNNATVAYTDSGPYSGDQWRERIYAAHTGDENTASQRTRLRGVVPTFDNLLVCAVSGDEIIVGTGAGIVYGSYLFNSAAVTFAPDAPVANPRIDLVCMVENNTNAAVDDGTEAAGWVFPTVLADYDATPGIPPYAARLVIVKGTENVAPAEPALDVSNTLFMVPVFKYQIAVGGAITLPVDRREFVDIEQIVGVDVLGNTTIEDALIIGTQVTNGAGAADLGVGIRAKLENDNGDLEDAGQLTVRWTDAANGSEDSRLELRLSSANAFNLSAVINAPTAASADGNARGAGAVDLQQVRSGVAQVASGDWSVISGGRLSTTSGDDSVIGGGYSNDISGNRSTIGGGHQNEITGTDSVIAGGGGDDGGASDGNSILASDFCSIIGGIRNRISNVSDYTTICGGRDNTIDDGEMYSFVGGGYTNTAGAAGVVGGGILNVADTALTPVVAGGYQNEATGAYSMIPGGYDNTADGDYSFAAGRQADTATFDGVFIWADSEAAAFTADNANQFKVRASGGTSLVQNSNAAALTVLKLTQTDQDETFIDFVGTSAADQTKSISTVNGDGAVTGPKNFSAAPGWEYVGMVKIDVNGAPFWIPYYQPDTA